MDNKAKVYADEHGRPVKVLMDGPVYRIMRIGNCAPRRWVPAMPDGFATFDQAQAALNQLAQEKGWAEWRQ